MTTPDANAPDDPLEAETLLRSLFGAEGHLWSVGTLGAFMALDAVGRPRPRTLPSDMLLAAGGVSARLRPGAHVLAFETVSSDPRGWNHGIALCMPAIASAPSRRVTRAEDRDPLDSADLGRPVLDLGLGQGPVRAFFRPDSEAAFAAAGKPWDEAAPLLATKPGIWAIDTPILRVERRGGDGGALHSLAQAFVSGRTHAETTPVPDGLIPVAHVFPPHPARHFPGAPMRFDHDRQRRFQAILARHGRPDLWALKQEVLAQLAAGRCDPPAADRHAAAVIRVALRQHLHLSGRPPRDWLERFDRPLMRALEAEGG